METKMILKKKSQVIEENKVKLNLVKKSELKSEGKPEGNNSNEDSDFEKISMVHFKKDFVKDMSPKKNIFDLNPVEVQKAFDRLIEMWNKDQKSRNFVKHLVSAFLPYNTFNRLMNVPTKSENPDEIFKPTKCAILNHAVTGIGNIARESTEYGMKKMFIDAHIMSEEIPEGAERRTHLNEEECKVLNDLKSKQSIPVQNYRVGVLSENSDKFLQIESIVALLHFSTEIIFISDELNFTVRKNMVNRAQENVPKEAKLSKKQVNQIVGQQLYGIEHRVDKSTYSALEKLKLELEKEQN